MSAKRSIRCPAVLALVAVLALGGAGCGGGGGGGDPGPVARIDLTVANRDSVSHASAASVLAFSPAAGLGVMSGSVNSDGRTALSAGFVQGSGWFSRVLGALLQAPGANTAFFGGARMRPLAVIGPIEEPCMVSGSVSVTIDDRDSSLSPSAGDVFTIRFNQCRDSEFETMDGTAVVSYTAMQTSPSLSMTARITATELASVAVDHALRLNGSMLLVFAQTGATTETSKLTADGSVVASITTHVFSDTVTLRSGFVEEAVYDSATRRTTSTVLGSIDSAAAGGTVDISSVAGAPIVNNETDDYPAAGAVRVKGRTGTLLMTALSSQAVRLELDTNDDGTADSVETVSWDWLL